MLVVQRCRRRRLDKRWRGTKSVVRALVAVTSLAVALAVFGAAWREWQEEASVNDTEYVKSMFKRLARKMRLRKREKAVLVDLLKTFDEFATVNNITYVLFAGTLLGAYRFGSLIPWDDDVDLLVDSAADQIIYDGFKGMVDFDCYRHNNGHLKVFSTEEARASGIVFHHDYDWTWPFLDLFLFKEENDTVTWGLGQYSYPREAFLPVTSRANFMGLRLPVPTDVEAALRAEYGEDVFEICVLSWYDHRHEVYINDDKKDLTYTIDCRELWDLFEFKQMKLYNFSDVMTFSN